MALNVTTLDKLVPVYSDLTLKAFDSPVSLYRFKVKVNNALVSTIETVPDPTGHGILKLNEVLEDHVESRVFSHTSPMEKVPDSIISYQIIVENLNVSRTVVSTYTSPTYYAFNGVKQDWENLNILEYIIKASGTCYFLSKKRVDRRVSMDGEVYVNTFEGDFGLTIAGTAAAEVASLKITAAATTSANVTINLNGVSKVVAVVAGDTAITVAGKIRNTAFSGWTTGGSGDTVKFTATTTGAKTDSTYSAGTTGATGTMTTTVQGKSETSNNPDFTTAKVTRKNKNSTTATMDLGIYAGTVPVIKSINISPSTLNAQTANFITNDTLYYEVWKANSNLKPVRFYLEHETKVKNTITLLYINSLGVTDSVEFNKVKQVELDIDRMEMQQGNRRKQFGTEVKYRVTVNSDWMTEQESKELEELWVSPHILVKESGQYIEILNRTNGVRIQNKFESKLIRYSFSFDYATKYRVQKY